MTDPTRAAAPAIDAAVAADWASSVERGAYEEALARLKALDIIGRGQPDARAALEPVVALLENLRGRDYDAAARRASTVERDDFPLPGLRRDGLSAAVQALQAGDESRRDPVAAARHFERALEHPLTAAEASNQLGVLAANDGEYAAARARFDDALRLDPRHFRALANLGNLELEAGDARAAEARYREAIRVNDTYATAYHNLAAALRRQGKRSESVAMLKRSQKLAVRDARAGGRGLAVSRYDAPTDRDGRPSVDWRALLANPTVRWVLLVLVIVLAYRFFKL